MYPTKCVSNAKVQLPEQDLNLQPFDEQRLFRVAGFFRGFGLVFAPGACENVR
jgi:hypothetical protein